MLPLKISTKIAALKTHSPGLKYLKSRTFSRFSACIVFLDSLYSFIYLFQLLVAMIYKGPMVLLIADIKLELVYSFVNKSLVLSNELINVELPP